MTDKQREEALKSLTDIFADRLRLPPLGDGSDNDDALASVLPSSVEEVRALSEVAARHSVPLVPFGARTGLEPRSTEGSILVRFDLMRNVRSPHPEEPWIEAEPGASWLQLEDYLRPVGRDLVVYPTSAPRATVGGWLAQDGLGVGSFEYGWLWENVHSASVVLAGGELREVPGEELKTYFGPEISKGIVVGARIGTRRAADVPFAAAFRDAGDLSGAVVSIFEARPPLWHLAFLSPAMARARNVGEDFLLFGAYPGERKVRVEEDLRGVLGHARGAALAAADAYRAWGERFFPVAPSHPTPVPTDRVLVAVEDLANVLDRFSPKAVQGTVARSGEVLLLAFDTRREDQPR
ncbi:MAG TPA: FAD-binding oxidoreductase [Rubrobacter sp.]|jgi:FAD/FMN-containing dehydrogenase|nr:FAD-binding oxidoreductase [Rubrobacter sp.]